LRDEVGIHYPERSQSTASKHAGIVAAGGKEVYFLGFFASGCSVLCASCVAVVEKRMR
jgi:hypothetical protein